MLSEAQAAEAAQVAAFVQGNLLMHCHQGITGLNVANVGQEVDIEGTYLPWFTITTASGIRVRVIVTPEDTP